MNTNKYKQITLLILCIFLIVCAGCSKSKTEKKINTTDIKASKVVAHIYNQQPLNSDYMCYMSEYPGWEDFASVYYRFDNSTIETIESFAMVSPLSASADEYVVIKTTDTDKVKVALDHYREIRTGDFTGYAPAEEAKLSETEVIVCNDYVALLVSDEEAKVKKAFEEALSEKFTMSDSDTKLLNEMEERCKSGNTDSSEDTTENISTEETSEDIDDEREPGRKVLPNGQVLIEEVPGLIVPYDTTHIVNAYKTNNRDSLSEPNDIAVYDKCVEILESEITADMTEYEKERAIHNYIIKNTDYDENCLIYSTWFSEYADQPYGCLIDNRAICLGYASTFKLFMDMLDIECIIVCGSANMDYENHAWNLVRLEDNNWYAVDVTWDDPVGANMVFYSFFNVDDRYLSDSSHHWNADEYPAATGGQFSGLE